MYKNRIRAAVVVVGAASTIALGAGVSAAATAPGVTHAPIKSAVCYYEYAYDAYGNWAYQWICV